MESPGAGGSGCSKLSDMDARNGIYILLRAVSALNA